LYFIINLAAFFILTLYAVKLMFSKPSKVNFKIIKEYNILLNGPEKFILFTALTGMFEVGPFSSLRLLVWILVIIAAFLYYKKIIKLNIVFIMYLLFLGWMILASVWAPSIEYSLRVFLKYLYPFLLMLFVATYVQSTKLIFILIKLLILEAFIFSIFLGGFMTHILGIWYFYFGGLFWPMATLADFLSIGAALSFVMWWKTGEKKYLFLIGWFLFSDVLQSVRTGLLGISAVLVIGSFLRYKLVSLPYIFGAIALAISIILYVPQVKNKMFFNPSKVQTVEDIIKADKQGNINTSMRSTMWSVLLNKFYKKNELIGSGTGAAQHYMYTNFVFGGLKAVHSDYVQMLCDIGKIGLGLYIMFFIFFILYANKLFFLKPNNYLNISALSAFLTYIAVLVSMGFDNIVNYSFATHSYPFLFIGLFFAYKNLRRIYD